MRVRVEWEPYAWSQFQNLPPPLQHAARAIAAALSENPYAGWFTRTSVRKGRTVYIRSYAGTEVVAEYYRGGLFRKTITVSIVSVRPMDWSSQEEYEECTRP